VGKVNVGFVVVGSKITKDSSSSTGGDI